MYDAVLFDNDGVLTWLTSLDVFSRAIETTFAEFGVTDPDPQHVEALYGVTPDELQRICERYGIDPAPFWRRRDRNAALAQHAEIRAGRKPLYDDVEILDELDQELGIVSNNQADTVSYIVDYYDLPGSDICYGRQPTLTPTGPRATGTADVRSRGPLRRARYRRLHRLIAKRTISATGSRCGRPVGHVGRCRRL